jgi:prolyl oligopeptidase
MLLTWRGDTAPNGPTPTVLAGYGGFNVPYLPSYSPSVHDWIMRGGLYAIAMLRGGGEFGEAWHRAGMRANKQAVFDDFYSAARYLVTQGYTDPTHLGVSGRSNGGLLTGAFVTQHPDAASAAIIGVPLLDMVRFHKFLIADLWTAEYGSPDVAEELEWLLAYSPYHHVRENTAYPAILLFTSEDDSRVDPMHARKMTARLQKATTSARPILFRQAAKTGHGVGKSATEWVDEEADIWTFLSYHLGLSVR